MTRASRKPQPIHSLPALEPYEDRIALSTFGPTPAPGSVALAYVKDVVGEVVTQTQSLFELARTANGRAALRHDSLANLRESGRNLIQNLPESFELQSLAMRDAAAFVDSTGDKVADAMPTPMSQFDARLAWGVVTGVVSTNLRAIETFDHVLGGQAAIWRDLANGKPVDPVTTVRVGKVDVPVPTPVFAAGRDLRDKGAEVVEIVTSKITDKLADKVIPATVGRKPEKLVSVLTGKHAQDAAKRAFTSEVIDAGLAPVKNALAGAIEHPAQTIHQATTALTRVVTKAVAKSESVMHHAVDTAAKTVETFGSKLSSWFHTK